MSEAASTDKVILAESLRKSYFIGRSELPVLSDAGMGLTRGESVAIVGASGAGKSTLLHVLGGLDRPGSGRVWINGADIYAMGETARARVRASQIGFVFQSYHLMPEMDVIENVTLPAFATAGKSSNQRTIRGRGMSLLASVGLEDRAGHTPMELSGGEQQRVALARALMNNPGLILADEPTGNLDHKAGAAIMDILLSLTRQGGHSLVLVTHNRETACRCDRVLNLCYGRLTEGRKEGS